MRMAGQMKEIARKLQRGEPLTPAEQAVVDADERQQRIENMEFPRLSEGARLYAVEMAGIVSIVESPTTGE
jgi:hypothetical protein